MLVKDISNQKFNKLTAVRRIGSNKHGQSIWECLCECGTIKNVGAGELKSGSTKSCGCTRRGENNVKFTHGKARSKVYRTWQGVKDRCCNPESSIFKYYGAKGVKISSEFAEDFVSFYEEVGDPPDESREWSIDRIDNTRNYERGNLRWVKADKQGRNRGMISTNTSGVNGVYVRTMGKDKKSVAVAFWVDLSHKHKQKCFSVEKLGLLPAFAAAVEYRRQMIAELNARGAGYTENHGK